MSSSAAWVQAIGSVIAIGVAIWVPWRQHQLQADHERQKDDLKARAMANAIYIHFLGLKAKTEGARANVSKHYSAHIKDHQFNKLERLKIIVPEVFNHDMDRFWMLGKKAAIPLLQAISIAQQYDDLMNSVKADLNNNVRSPTEALDMEDHLLKYTQSILDLIPEIDEALAPLIDGDTP